jgi:branched-chain amino acid transport system ATP-binding protein
LQDVEVRYGPVPALREVTMEIRRGEIVCLLGGNASGKSTTMKAVIGSVRCSRGSIWYEGQDITSWNTARRVTRGIAIVPEARRIFPRLTVLENLMLGAFTRHEKDEIDADLERVLEMFPRLRERRGQRGGTMSGGEQQMLAMARILRVGARLLLLDEITEGLAPVIVQTLGKVVRGLGERGLTMILVEQNFRFVSQLADRHYLIEHGRIVDMITKHEVGSRTEALHRFLGV